MQGDLEGTGYVEHVDGVGGHTLAFELGKKCVARLVHDVGVPLGLDKSNPSAVWYALDAVEGKVVDLTHGFPEEVS